jgi:glycine cleavage system H protein
MKFSKEHEWAKLEGNTVTVGITDYAAHQLGDVVFVEMPTVGSKIKQGATIGTIESVKTVSDLYSPVSGEVIAVNEELESNPALVNEAPMSNGWISKSELPTPKNLIRSFQKLNTKKCE